MTSTRSISTPSQCSSGRSAGDVDVDRPRRECRLDRSIALPTSSSSDCQSRRSVTPPVCSRAISSRLSTSCAVRRACSRIASASRALGASGRDARARASRRARPARSAACAGRARAPRAANCAAAPTPCRSSVRCATVDEMHALERDRDQRGEGLRAAAAARGPAAGARAGGSIASTPRVRIGALSGRYSAAGGRQRVGAEARRLRRGRTPSARSPCRPSRACPPVLGAASRSSSSSTQHQSPRPRARARTTSASPISHDLLRRPARRRARAPSRTGAARASSR